MVQVSSNRFRNHTCTCSGFYSTSPHEIPLETIFAEEVPAPELLKNLIQVTILGNPLIYYNIYIYMLTPRPPDLPFGGLVSLVQVLMTRNSY